MKGKDLRGAGHPQTGAKGTNDTRGSVGEAEASPHRKMSSADLLTKGKVGRCMGRRQSATR